MVTCKCQTVMSPMHVGVTVFQWSLNVLNDCKCVGITCARGSV